MKLTKTKTVVVKEPNIAIGLPQQQSLVDVFNWQTEKIGKLETALENIFSNTYRLEPSVFRSGVLANIEMALGKERYEYLKELNQ